MAEITGQERRGWKRLVHGAGRRLARRGGRFSERSLGIHLVPVRYDDPIPRLDEVAGSWWDEPQALAGIDLRIDEQLTRLARWSERYVNEWNFAVDPVAGAPHVFYRRNASYGNGDAEILWAMLREHKPARVLELGSGFTTRLAAAALERNRAEGKPGDLVSVDPYPGDVTRAGFPGLTQLLVSPAQAIPVDEFRTLSAGDVLLVDSSHMFKVGSDVAYLFEHVLPRLEPGVLVHLHDVYLPRPYPPDVYRAQQWYWNEQNVLRVYLCENPAWEVVWSVNALFRDRHEAFAAAVPGTVPGHSGPCSFWIRRATGPSSCY